MYVLSEDVFGTAFIGYKKRVPRYLFGKSF